MFKTYTYTNTIIFSIKLIKSYFPMMCTRICIKNMFATKYKDEEDAFGLFELPHKYISTGVRADRANPSHVRISAMVKFPKGKHRLLLRSRGASRVMIDGKKILENPFPSGDTGGHGKISAQDTYLDLGPDFRFVPPGNRENWIEYESPGGSQFVILETMLGASFAASVIC